MPTSNNIATFNQLFNDYYQQFVRFAMGYIKDEAKAKGTGKWTSQSAMDLQVSIPVIDIAVSMRDLSKYKLFSEEIEQIIENTINNLPKRTGQIFRMSRFEHLSHREIAKKLDLTTKSVEYHITKTLNELRHNLKDFLTILVLFCIYF